MDDKDNNNIDQQNEENIQELELDNKVQSSEQIDNNFNEQNNNG